MPNLVNQDQERKEQTVDNNNPVTNPAAPVVDPLPKEQPVKKSKTMWLIVGLVLVILLIAGIYLLQSRQKASQSVKVSPSPVAGADNAGNLEQDLNSINIGNVEPEFSDVDQDLQSL